MNIELAKVEGKIMNEEGNEMINTTEASSILERSLRQVQNLSKMGKLVAVTVSGRWYITKKSVLARKAILKPSKAGRKDGKSKLSQWEEIE